MVILPLLIFIFMISTVVMLVLGLIFMALGNKLNAKYGNKLMNARVTLQTITLCLLVLYFLFRNT
ncbi:MAG: HIG1 domain-containing protein [Rickettsiales endosymbiont of Dermacentor nuttalli]